MKRERSSSKIQTYYDCYCYISRISCNNATIVHLSFVDKAHKISAHISGELYAETLLSKIPLSHEAEIDWRSGVSSYKLTRNVY